MVGDRLVSIWDTVGSKSFTGREVFGTCSALKNRRGLNWSDYSRTTADLGRLRVG